MRERRKFLRPRLRFPFFMPSAKEQAGAHGFFFVWLFARHAIVSKAIKKAQFAQNRTLLYYRRAQAPRMLCHVPAPLQPPVVYVSPTKGGATAPRYVRLLCGAPLVAQRRRAYHTRHLAARRDCLPCDHAPAGAVSLRQVPPRSGARYPPTNRKQMQTIKKEPLRPFFLWILLISTKSQ